MNNDSRSGRTLQIAILGAGAGGLCAAVKLKEAGINDFVILEKASGLGGTWFHNTYPGCACDLPSAIYSFSFEINREWSRPYAPQSEILTYLENIAAKHELLGHCRFNSEVSGIKWNHERALWIVTIAFGETLEAEIYDFRTEYYQRITVGVARSPGRLCGSADQPYQNGKSRMD